MCSLLVMEVLCFGQKLFLEQGQQHMGAYDDSRVVAGQVQQATLHEGQHCTALLLPPLNLQ